MRFMRSLRGEAHQGPHPSVFARLASGAFYETIVPLTFYEISNFLGPSKSFRRRISARMGTRMGLRSTIEDAVASRYLQTCDIPLAENPLGPFVMVVFGGAGDLSQRKLLPALFRLLSRRPPSP